jgi:uncharacterized protein YdaU (DUF1376 family)
MHYYSFNIGDYASHTRHLTPMEDLVYRRLLDLYYLHEQPLNDCSTTVARLINLRGNEVEVETVLQEFFEHIDGSGWVNRRADEEIAKYHGKLEAASRAGRASAERRSNARSTDVQPNKKQEPITNNQETNKKPKGIDIPTGVSPATWSDFLVLRKSKKAPVTESAIKGIEREARKAGWSLEKALLECCARGWIGFKADWVQTDAEKKMTPNQASNLAFARAVFGDERNLNHDEFNTIDITPGTQAPAGLLGAEDL